MISEDYNKIVDLIDDIIGVNTYSGNNLKLAIKNYFERKPITVKLDDKIRVDNFIKEADKAMEKYTARLIEELKQMKANK